MLLHTDLALDAPEDGIWAVPVMGTSALRGNCAVIQSVDTEWTGMSCEDCDTKFSILKRRRTCCDCSHDFCTSCVMRVKGLEKRHRCHRCRIFSSVPLDRNAIMGLRVRDLRWFLGSNAVPIHGCKEKSDLVDLIMHHSQLKQAAVHYPQNYERHTSLPELLNCDSPRGSSESSPVRVHNDPTPSIGSETEIDIEAAENEIQSTNPEMEEEILPNNDDNVDDTEQQTETSVTVKEEVPFAPNSVQGLDWDKIPTLSVRQLKLILTRNFIDYKGCCEKRELREKVQWLWLQKRDSKDIDSIADENLCKICMGAVIDSVLLECGHMATCTDCGKRLHECPICRQYVIRVVHIFKA